jgi:hypothetical protein
MVIVSMDRKAQRRYALNVEMQTLKVGFTCSCARALWEPFVVSRKIKIKYFHGSKETRTLYCYSRAFLS